MAVFPGFLTNDCVAPVILGVKYSPVSLKACIPDRFADDGKKAAPGTAREAPCKNLPVSPSTIPSAISLDPTPIP